MLISRRVLLQNSARSNRRDEEKEWSSLWQVKVPSKLRVFLWRLARHSLPSANVLHHWNMDHTRCVFCGASDSWRHSLLECNMARCVWALECQEIVEHLCELQEEDSRAWLATLIETMPHGDLTRVVVTLWAIWYARRKAIFENSFQSPLSTHMFVNNYIAELQASKPAQVTKPIVPARRPRWLPPLS